MLNIHVTFCQIILSFFDLDINVDFGYGFLDRYFIIFSVKFEILVFDAESEPKFHISSFIFDLEIAMLNIYVTFCQIILSCFFRFRYQC